MGNATSAAPQPNGTRKKNASSIQLYIMGDKKVGKTALYHRLCGNPIPSDYEPTLENTKCRIQRQIEIHEIVQSKGFKHVDGVLFVVNITQKKTLEYVVNRMHEVPNEVPILIYGTHRDKGQEREIMKQHIVQVMEKSKRKSEIVYFEGSNVDCYGLNVLFEYIKIPYWQKKKVVLHKQLKKIQKELDTAKFNVDQAIAKQRYTKHVDYIDIHQADVVTGIVPERNAEVLPTVEGKSLNGPIVKNVEESKDSMKVTPDKILKQGEYVAEDIPDTMGALKMTHRSDSQELVEKKETTFSKGLVKSEEKKKNKIAKEHRQESLVDFCVSTSLDSFYDKEEESDQDSDIVIQRTDSYKVRKMGFIYSDSSENEIVSDAAKLERNKRVPKRRLSRSSSKSNSISKTSSHEKQHAEFNGQTKANVCANPSSAIHTSTNESNELSVEEKPNTNLRNSSEIEEKSTPSIKVAHNKEAAVVKDSIDEKGITTLIVVDLNMYFLDDQQPPMSIPRKSCSTKVDHATMQEVNELNMMHVKDCGQSSKDSSPKADIDISDDVESIGMADKESEASLDDVESSIVEKEESEASLDDVHSTNMTGEKSEASLGDVDSTYVADEIQSTILPDDIESSASFDLEDAKLESDNLQHVHEIQQVEEIKVSDLSDASENSSNHDVVDSEALSSVDAHASHSEANTLPDVVEASSINENGKSTASSVEIEENSSSTPENNIDVLPPSGSQIDNPIETSAVDLDSELEIPAEQDCESAPFQHNPSSFSMPASANVDENKPLHPGSTRNSSNSLDVIDDVVSMMDMTSLNSFLDASDNDSLPDVEVADTCTPISNPIPIMEDQEVNSALSDQALAAIEEAKKVAAAMASSIDSKPSTVESKPSTLKSKPSTIESKPSVVPTKSIQSQESKATSFNVPRKSTRKKKSRSARLTINKN